MMKGKKLPTNNNRNDTLMYRYYAVLFESRLFTDPRHQFQINRLRKGQFSYSSHISKCLSFIRIC